MLLGKHCSISGGVENALEEAYKLGIDTIQIFTKNQRQWREKEISFEEGERFKKKCLERGVKIALSHTIYLINLASNDTVRNQSILALAGELIRCETLGIQYTVLHPGTNKNLSEKEAIKKIADAINIVAQHTPGIKAKVLLENTAGQGACIGRNFEQIKEIMSRSESANLGLCFDTCHAFAAGFDIRTETGLEDTFSIIDKNIGLEHLKVIHMNDSKGELGSRLDRHEHIGKGKIGLKPFQYIMEAFPGIPKVLETNSQDGMDIINLDVLKSMITEKL